MKPGIRVVRGPDWNSKRQDGGEGFLGTIIFVPKTGSSDKKVTVIWDSGRELRYNAGEDGKYELRVFDTGPAGSYMCSLLIGKYELYHIEPLIFLYGFLIDHPIRYNKIHLCNANNFYWLLRRKKIPCEGLNVVFFICRIHLYRYKT